jgi:hypothetical protein
METQTKICETQTKNICANLRIHKQKIYDTQTKICETQTISQTNNKRFKLKNLTEGTLISCFCI